MGDILQEAGLQPTLAGSGLSWLGRWGLGQMGFHVPRGRWGRWRLLICFLWGICKTVPTAFHYQSTRQMNYLRAQSCREMPRPVLNLYTQVVTAFEQWRCVLTFGVQMLLIPDDRFYNHLQDASNPLSIRTGQCKKSMIGLHLVWQRWCLRAPFITIHSPPMAY